MGYKYQRKSTRGGYGLDKLNEALHKVRSRELSKRKAEYIYGVPRKTISRHLAGKVAKVGNLGRYECIFGKEVEQALVNHALKLQLMFFGLSISELRKLAYDLAVKLNVQHRFKNQCAGKSWLRGFLARHPELVVRSPEPTSLGRAVGFNKPSVQKFFDIYKSELTKDTYTSDQIFNMDESGVTVVHRPGKVISRRGQKQIGKVTSGEKGQTTTVICAVNAAGFYVPPMLIFKRKRFTEQLMKDSPPGAVGACSPNGWVDSGLFVKWLTHFISVVKPSPARKVILILDGHSSHKTLAAIELARENGVVMMSLPPHTTHMLQPLDKTIFGSLKAKYNHECDKWMLSHAGQRISQFDVAGLFGAAYVKNSTMEKAISGFRCTGLWPFNPDIFTEDDFLPSMTTDEPEPGTVAVLQTESYTSNLAASAEVGLMFI